MNEIIVAIIFCTVGAVLLVWALATVFTADTLKETRLQVDAIVANGQTGKKLTTLSLVEEDSVMKGNPDLYYCYNCRTWFHHRSYCSDSSEPRYCPICGGAVTDIVKEQ